MCVAVCVAVCRGVSIRRHGKIKRNLQLNATHTHTHSIPPPHARAQERLEREYDLDLITTAPTVVYRCMGTDGVEKAVNSPGDLPEATKREYIAEPYCR